MKHINHSLDQGKRQIISLILIGSTVGCQYIPQTQTQRTSNSIYFRVDKTESTVNSKKFQSDWKKGCHEVVDSLKIGDYISYAAVNSLNPVYTEPNKVTSTKRVRRYCNQKIQSEENSGATNPCIIWDIDNSYIRPNTLYVSAVQVNDSNEFCDDTLKSLVSNLENTGGHFIALASSNKNNFNSWMRDVLKEHDSRVSFCGSTEISDTSNCVRDAIKLFRSNNKN
jgi:hypothetical protein